VLLDKNTVTVLEFPNFMDSEQCKKLVSICRSEKNSWIGDRNELMEFIPENQILEDIYKSIVNFFAGEPCVLKTNGAIQRSSGGFGVDLHSDAEGLESIQYGLILYLNNDYEGGYLVYPSLGIAVKPEPGLLVLHRGDLPHFVSMYGSEQERYLITIFLLSYEEYSSL